ncbi:Caspase domain-containing protein [Granulicella pectinivorans]|uniref:Caspase domain-containing protein n=1 Tax=Granulicella pectinivorans TaxID=474950 RepID=A0A1I6MIK9_9BACT|nr:caspase family protein [Granulicella pectinivorans]SFS15451.1 Caspase domain-containing protein [Granulicella pectinivorans]
MGTTYAVLIGIETYQKQGISSVQFAQADAAAMKDVLVQHFGVPAENISLWLDSDATRSSFENDLTYTIRHQLSPGDRFIFFYAGHGFYANGSNRLTTWDTHPSNLAGTTVSLEEVLLKPLKEQQGIKSLVFIDACAADLKTSVEQARDMVSDLTPMEFEALVQSTDHAAAFFACSPNEKAYPSDALMHGIWTYHLMQALQGDAEGALDRDRWITGDSLKNYLALAVPAYIRENTKIQAAQRPYAILSSNGPFSIRQVPPSDSAKPASLAATEAKLLTEQPPTQTSGARPQIMLSAIEGHSNQWSGDVFTLHHLGGDAALKLQIAPIRFEGFNQVSLHFEAVPFIGPTKPDAKVHFHVVTNDDGVPRHVNKPSFVMMSFVKDAQHLNKPEVSYPVAVRFQWGAKTEEEHFLITWNNNRRRMTTAPSNNLTPQKKANHNIVFLNAEVVKLRYSGPGYSDRTDGKHSFSEVEGVSTGDIVGLIARFRNEAVYGGDVASVHGVRAHLKLFDRKGKEIGTGFSGAQWLGHPDDTFDLIPNGRGGSVIVCRGGKTTKPLVMWKAQDAAGRLRDRDLELNDGYPSKAEITLMDSNHRPLLQPVVLDITESAGEFSVSARQ